jgi:hypothetical protein
MTEGTVNRSWIRNILGLLWRSLVIGLGYTLVTMLGGMFAQALGLPPSELGSQMDPTQAILFRDTIIS